MGCVNSTNASMPSSPGHYQVSPAYSPSPQTGPSASSMSLYSTVESLSIGEFESVGEMLASRERSFIRFERPDEYKRNAGRALSDKLHVSVDSRHVEQAFNMLSPYLTSGESPFDLWKITHMPTARNSSDAEAKRIYDGAQFTLYIHSDVRGGAPSTSHLGSIRESIQILNQRLSDANICRGVIPKSDAPINRSSFVSYRNESLPEASIQTLKQQPVFKVLSY